MEVENVVDFLADYALPLEIVREEVVVLRVVFPGFHIGSAHLRRIPTPKNYCCTYRLVFCPLLKFALPIFVRNMKGRLALGIARQICVRIDCNL